MQGRFWVYMLASRWKGTLYTGVTNDLCRRLFEHKHSSGSAFTRKYGVMLLVWYEEHATPQTAITREKAIKTWPRKWKLDLINQSNPTWQDLGETVNA